MLGRRALGAAAAALGVGSSNVPLRSIGFADGGLMSQQQVRAVGYSLAEAGGESLVVRESPAVLAARRAFQAALSESRRRRSRKLQIAERLGGLPPQLASMKSCAPWFLHQRAAVWQHNVEQEDRGVLHELGVRLGIFDKDSDELGLYL